MGEEGGIMKERARFPLVTAIPTLQLVDFLLEPRLLLRTADPSFIFL